MPTKLILPGRAVEPPTRFEPDLSEFLNVEIKRVQIVDAAAAAARGVAGEEQAFADAEETDIVEREWSNGVKQWVSVAQLRQDLGPAAGAARGVSADLSELRVLDVPPIEGAQRGGFDWALKGLKILRIDPAEKAAQWTARQIVEHFENQLKPEAGLYRLSGAWGMEEKKLAVGDLDTAAPYLVFIHGTASTTAGSFGKLAGTPEWDTLQKRYGGRTLGFQHRTMSQSPIQNALELAQTLPAGAKLHFVTHSRGGLVGELLCLRPLEKADLAPFVAAHRKDDVALLEQLSRELSAKNFQIEKFVRVACPARGTILASQRLDLYFSIILNLLGLIPALQASPIYSFVKATLLELAKRRTRPEELPGLEAQMPESPVIHLLNRPGVTTKADLAVIAGDITGGGVWSSLKALATDLYYWEDHDLVVNTKAMYGGMNREQGAYYFFDQGPDVNHFSYFANSRTRQRMLGWLTRADGQPRDENFQLIARSLDRGLVVKQTRAAAADLPVVFLVPGLMGTHLKDAGGDRVWLHFLSLALGGMARLGFAAKGVQPDVLVALAYQRLVDFLQDKYKVVPFPYDWRLSIETEGARLAKEVKAELKRHGKPVRILAHSLGGLVARAMIGQDPQLWQDTCGRGGRLIMLGVPNLGSFVIPRLLLGKEKILRQLSLLDFRHRLGGVIDIIRHFPGLLEMLPEGKDGPDFFAPEWWSRVPGGFPVPDSSALDRAKAARAKIFKAGVPQNSIYVAGSAPATPSGIQINSDGSIMFETTPDGDGRVAYHPQFLEGVPTWYMDAVHGELANHPPAFDALLELLNTGQTGKLDGVPRRQRGVTVVLSPPLRDTEPLLFPQEEELVAAAIGIAAAPSRAEQIHTLRISVAHGDLARAKYPVAVGHYRGDAIVSAESRLDKLLNRRLSELFGMYLYPGPIGSAEVILEREGQPKGALIIGLGEVGEITPEIVRRGITNAALRYALLVANEARPGAELSAAHQQNGARAPQAAAQAATSADAQTWRSAAFSALLVGTYGGNALSVDSAVSAIIQGAIQANQALRARKLWERVRIDEVQIVELYEDVAIQAARAAHNLEQRPPTEITEQEKLMVEPPYLESLGGGRFQRPANQYARGWWRRIQITGERDHRSGARTGNLHYLSLTDRARAEDTLQSTQRELINGFIEKAVHSSTYDEKLASTLFELLFPNVLKEQTQVEASMVLVVDQDAAQYPWELLAQRVRGGSQPLALRMGLLRQFVTSDYHPTPQPARDRNALVIGVTQAIEVREGKFPALPGARAEALEVSKVIGDAGYDVSSTLIDADGLTVISELLTKEHRILHLAGHGVYHARTPRLHLHERNGSRHGHFIHTIDEPLRSGMILGDGVFLATTELRSLGAIPELAFINCCYLAQIDNELKLANPSPHRLAASIAQELINKGVKAVVAAGWAVEDQAAAAFAKAFYKMMLDGQSFGEAVRYARQTTYKQFPGNNTWGAYQCYGNPGFVLEQSGAKRSSVADKTRGLYSRQEYLEELLTITEEAARAGAERRAEMGQQLNRLDKALPSHWRDGGVLGEFGEAWAALGNFAQAIDYYRQAIKQEKAEAPLSAVEQLANLLSRHAEVLRVSAAELDGMKPAELEAKLLEMVKEALSLLDWALELGETNERLSNYGGYYKRLALAAKVEERPKLLEKARDYYGQAHRQNVANGTLDFYPALNWIACRYLLGEKKLKGDRSLLKLIKDCKQAAARKAQREPHDFWSRVAEPDAELLAHLINDDLPAHKAKILKLYQKVIAPGAKPKDIASVKGQYDSYIRILASRPGTNQAATLAALKEIQAAIGR